MQLLHCGDSHARVVGPLQYDLLLPELLYESSLPCRSDSEPSPTVAVASQAGHVGGVLDVGCRHSRQSRLVKGRSGKGHDDEMGNRP